MAALMWADRRRLALLNTLVALFVVGPVVTPLLLAAGATSTATDLYRFFHLLCHQWAFRSFFVLGSQATFSRDQLITLGVDPYTFLGDAQMGWKMAFCERNLAIFVGQLAFGLAFGSVHQQMPPARFAQFVAGRTLFEPRARVRCRGRADWHIPGVVGARLVAGARPDRVRPERLGEDRAHRAHARLRRLQHSGRAATAVDARWPSYRSPGRSRARLRPVGPGGARGWSGGTRCRRRFDRVGAGARGFGPPDRSATGFSRSPPGALLLAPRVGISPAAVGQNHVAVELSGAEPTTVERVQLTLTYLDDDLGGEPLIL